MDAVAQIIREVFESTEKKPEQFELIREKGRISVYRCVWDGKRAVAKHFAQEGDRREIENYRFLMKRKVPVIKVFALCESCILMEDIGASDTWRLGREEDLSDPDVLRALARWYFCLHDRCWFLGDMEKMYSENDELNEASIALIREQVPGSEALCDYMLKHLNRFRAVIREMEDIAVYNDFYYTNFIVAKDKSAAMMFDYNCMGRGYRYADFRNVESSVSPEAYGAFVKEYSALHEERFAGFDRPVIKEAERQLDEFISQLAGLAIALKRAQFPAWAEDAKAGAADGRLLEKAKAVMEAQARRKLIGELEEYAPFNEQEEMDREEILRRLRTEEGELFTRSNNSAHMTASAWVISPDRQHVLMAYHNLYQSWAWLGGHADGDGDLMETARREVMEESGLKNVRPLSNTIFSVEALTVDGHRKKGKYVSSHLHLNVTYLFEADMEEDLAVRQDENSAVGWIRVDELHEKVSEPWFLEWIYSKLSEKAERLGRMKKVILSHDSPPAVYAVPDPVAERLREYCIEFCDEWMENSPDAEKYYRHGGKCYSADDFIDYLNRYIFPQERSFAVWRTEWLDGVGVLPPEYRELPHFNF